MDEKVYTRWLRICNHKRIIRNLASYMIQQLGTDVNEKLKDEIIDRADRHDMYDIEEENLLQLVKIDDGFKSMKDPNSKLEDSSWIQDLLWEYKYSLYDYYPEHYVKDGKSIEEMPEVARIEMVLDWASCSVEFGTNFLEFVTTRQKNRFEFPEYFWNEVYSYCELIAPKVAEMQSK